MRMDFNYENTNGLANALGGRIDLLEKMLGLKVREGLKYADIQKIVKSGFAKEFFDLGDEIMTTYTATDGTEYDFPWRIVDFRDVYWENDPAPHPGMVLMSKYVTLEEITYGTDPSHIVPDDETIAEEGWYYYGSSRSLDLKPGDTIPHDEYSAIYKYGINIGTTDHSIRTYGLGDYIFTSVRQWLNSDAEADSWWTPSFLGDNAPSESSIYNGFMHGFESDFIDAIIPTRLVTWHLNDGSMTPSASYDRFYVPSPIELYGRSEADSRNPGEDQYFEYFKNRIEKEGYDYPYSGATASRIFYLLNNPTVIPAANKAPYVRGRPSAEDFTHAQNIGTTGALGAYNKATNRKNIIPCCVIS